MYKLFKTSYELLPNTYNFLASKSKLSEKRKIEIEERRGRLKTEDDDIKIVRIVIEEMLAYKPGIVTLDDRYLQLEQILDAIDKTRKTKQPEYLIRLCDKITNQLSASPGKFKNYLLERLESINFRIKTEDENYNTLRAKI